MDDKRLREGRVEDGWEGPRLGTDRFDTLRSYADSQHNLASIDCVVSVSYRYLLFGIEKGELRNNGWHNRCARMFWF